MSDHSEFIRYRIEFSQPIELEDFVQAFSSIGSEYERFIAGSHPDFRGDAKVFLRKIEEGSIVAELVAYSTTLLSSMGVSTASEFAKHLGGSLSNAIIGNLSGEKDSLPKKHLSDLRGMLEVVAKDPNGEGSLSVYRKIEDGSYSSEEILRYDTRDANKGVSNLDEAVRQLGNPSREKAEQVLMVFHQVNRNIGPLDKRSGDKVTIVAKDPKPKAIVYLSDEVQRAIKREITEAEENVMKRGFIVDVDVERLPNGNIAAYILTAIHDIFELPDD